MRTVATIMLGAALLAPLTAQAQSVTIARGEEVILTLDATANDGTTKIVARTATMASNFEIATAMEFQRGDHDKAVGPIGERIAGDHGAALLAPTPVPGRLRLRFTATSRRDQSLLSIENGYAWGLVYRARMVVRGKAEPTDVCLVIPGRIGNEFWPYPIDALDLDRFKLVSWNESDPIKCA